MSNVIDGRALSAKIKDKVKGDVDALKRCGISICLAVVLVGEDPASLIYVKNKKKACEEVGICSKEILLSSDINSDDLILVLKTLNKDSSVNGILLQLPLPKHLEEKKIINYIDPLKDVDCFHVNNLGKIVTGCPFFLPCTPAGIVDLIEFTGEDISGKHCTVVGRSNIVGKPVSMLMLKKDATVTICHSKTKNIEFFTRSADILIAAVGVANFIKHSMVKDGAIVIDVGVNRLSNGKLCGDVDFFEVKKKAKFITPVPGGVGPMTIAKLLENTIKAAKIQNGKI